MAASNPKTPIATNHVFQEYLTVQILSEKWFSFNSTGEPPWLIRHHLIRANHELLRVRGGFWTNLPASARLYNC